VGFPWSDHAGGTNGLSKGSKYNERSLSPGSLGVLWAVDVTSVINACVRGGSKRELKLKHSCKELWCRGDTVCLNLGSESGALYLPQFTSMPICCKYLISAESGLLC